jgi:hypothetical protein
MSTLKITTVSRVAQSIILILLFYYFTYSIAISIIPNVQLVVIVFITKLKKLNFDIRNKALNNKNN